MRRTTPYYKNLAEKSLHPTPQPQAYGPRSNPLPSVAPKSNTRSGPSGNTGSNVGSQNKPQQTVYGLPPNLSGRTASRNPFINDTRTWIKQLGALCVSCGKCGHTSKQCTDSYLPAWERAYLKAIVFGDPPQVSFVHLGGGEQDQDTSPFGCYNTPAPHQSFTSYDSTRSNSVSVGREQKPNLASELNSMSVNAFYGESSRPNKRPNVGSEHIPVNRPKRKGQRRVGKKTEAIPLAGMIDEISGAFDKPVSVREVLKRNRVDTSLMDWIAWSPTCKELKTFLHSCF